METSNALPLEELMEQFIEQAIKFRRIRPKLITHYQMQLIGTSVPFLHLGYIRYLKSIDVSKPKIDDLSSFLVGRYWEFRTPGVKWVLSARSATHCVQAT